MTNGLNANIERLRIVSALGVVAFHAQTGLVKSIGYAGLPAFVLITFFLGTISLLNKQEGFSTYLAGKTKRLLLPFIVWVGVYLVYDCLVATIKHQPLSTLLTEFNLLYGTSIHLWYLPFAFLGLLLIFVVGRGYLASLSYLSLVILLLLAATSGLFIDYLGALVKGMLPLPQYAFAFPALLFAVSLAAASRMSRPAKAVTYFAVIIIVAALVMIKAATAGHNAAGFAYTYGIAVPVMVAALSWPGEVDRLTGLLAPLTLGIYLVHPMIIGVLNRLAFFRYGIAGELKFVAVFCVSAGVIYLIRLTKLKIIA